MLSLLASLATDFINEIKFRSTPSQMLMQTYLSDEKYLPLKNLDVSKLPLNEKEGEEVLRLTRSLGDSTKENQLSGLEFFKEKTDAAARAAADRLDGQIRVTNSLGFFGGIFISLLMM